MGVSDQEEEGGLQAGGRKRESWESWDVVRYGGRGEVVADAWRWPARSACHGGATKRFGFLYFYYCGLWICLYYV
jgi:hypothetical protein